MKKILLNMMLVLAVLSFAACKTNVGDDKNSLPVVDTKKYEIAKGEFKFPAGTPALDIYSTLYKAVGDKEVKTATGEYTLSVSHKYPDTGNITVDSRSYNIVNLKLYRKHNEASNEFHAVITTNSIAMVWDAKKEKYVENGFVTNDFCYAWQLNNTNVWKNNKCGFTFTLNIPEDQLK